MSLSSVALTIIGLGLAVVPSVISSAVPRSYYCPASPLAQSITRSTPARPVQLAVAPQCASLSSAGFGNINTGICLESIRTLYTFGDSYTDNGRSDGQPAYPAAANGTNPFYGGRNSNGPMYSEYLVPWGAVVKNYAIGGATVDRRLWYLKQNNTDMVSHVTTFIDQRNYIDRTTSLAVVFYGINDNSGREKGPGTMREAAYRLLYQVELLIAAGFTQLLIISVPDDNVYTRDYDNVIWQGMKNFRQTYRIEFAFIDLMALWKPLLEHPTSFGFASRSSCLPSSATTVDGCWNPDDYVFWTPGHPQTLLHMLISNWIKTVLNTCRLF